MNISNILAIFLLAFFSVALAANEKEILIHVRPITRSQYESIMKISDGKPVIPEGRLVNSAISGLSGLAAGFHLSKYLPNLFGTHSQNKGSAVLGGYPLCTIGTDSATGRQNNDNSFLNIEELTNSLVPSTEGSNNLPTMNCILVLDDGKERPDKTTTTTSTTTTTTIKPTTTTTTTAKPPTFRPTPPVDQPTYRPIPPHIPPFYPSYPYYPYPAYPIPFYPPPYIHYHHNYEPEEDDEEEEKVETSEPPQSSISFETFLMNKLNAFHGLSSTTTTTKKPTKKSSRRNSYRRPSHYEDHFLEQ